MVDALEVLNFLMILLDVTSLIGLILRSPVKQMNQHLSVIANMILMMENMELILHSL